VCVCPICFVYNPSSKLKVNCEKHDTCVKKSLYNGLEMGLCLWLIFLLQIIMCVQFATEPPKVQVEQVVSKHVENHFTRFREGVLFVYENEGYHRIGLAFTLLHGGQFWGSVLFWLPTMWIDSFEKIYFSSGNPSRE
jgi:hypothetical protein